jgi:hypothetical protein
MTPLLILLQVKTFFKIIQIIVLSSIRLIVGPPVSIEIGLNYLETFAATAAGGIVGVFIFYHLSGWMIRAFRKNIKPFFIRLFQNLKQKRKPQGVPVQNKSKTKRLSSLNKKMFMAIRKKWGLLGICILTPTIFSIPLGSFLANKYYSGNKNTIVYLAISVIAWSFIVSTVYFFSTSEGGEFLAKLYFKHFQFFV